MASVTQAEAEPPLALALDVGSSSVRAILFDRLGREVQGMAARRPYRMNTTADGGVEVSADALLALVEESIDGALGAAGPMAAKIACVGACTFWHSLLGVGADGAALTRVYTWADTRSAAAAER